MVFQEYALFPWLTVEKNVHFAMRAAGKWSRSAPAKANAILARLGLDQFRHAFPKNLSGGMRQRLAIGRILAIDGPVMLMDEPFGALDALTRGVLQADLVALWQETRKTDFTGTCPQTHVPMNSGRSGGMAAARVAFKSAVVPNLPPNDGVSRALRVTLPEGTIISAVDNAAMAQWNMPLKTVIVTVYGR